MNKLEILASQTSPGILLDKTNGVFEISGNSLPEDPANFFAQIFDWIDEYSKEPNPTTLFTFKMLYFNSASSKGIMEMLNLLENIHRKGFDVKIQWSSLEIDEDMLDSGKEFASMVKIPFNFTTFA